MAETAPLPQGVIRNLSDRIYEKRKTAALEIENRVKELNAAKDSAGIHRILTFLSNEFALSNQSNHRKGGLIGLAAAALGLNQDTHLYLDLLLKPVLNCFTDQDSRVRYYACEALYNIAKVARRHLLKDFNSIFEGLCKLCADPDMSVKSGSQPLDRLMKDIISESEAFDVEKFIPLLRELIGIPNQNVRMFLVGWISLLNSVPDIELLHFLPDFLSGLFDMLSDPQRDIRQQADAVLSEFLRELKTGNEVDYGRMIPIVVGQMKQPDALCRRTAIFWMHEFTCLGRDAILPYAAEHDLLGALLRAMSQTEEGINTAAAAAAAELKQLIHNTDHDIAVARIMHQALSELTNPWQPTRVTVLGWISMLLRKVPNQLSQHFDPLFAALLDALLDESDEVVKTDLEVLSEISRLDEHQFTRFISDLLGLMRREHQKGSGLNRMRRDLIVRELCQLLDAETIFRTFSLALESDPDPTFADLTVQHLNLILLTASELLELRALLRECRVNAKGAALFKALYQSWCRDAVATLSLCLLAQNYQLASDLVEKFATLEMTVMILVRLDQLVQLLESPIFASLRMHLLDPTRNPYLLKALYGVLMLLPQSPAFHTLRKRLACVPTLALLQLTPMMAASTPDRTSRRLSPPGGMVLTEELALALDSDALLQHFDQVHHCGQKERPGSPTRGGGE